MGLIAVFITFLFTAGAAGLGKALLGRWTSRLDPALAFGVHGLSGLGALGMLTLPIGLLPGGTHWGIFPIGALAVFGLYKLGTSRELAFKGPSGSDRLFWIAFVVCGLIALVSVLAPSDPYDWDTLAYHLAVPKIWLAAGRIEFVSYIHHSNFPFTVDNLYLWGLTWGGQAGAKAFSLAFAILGGVSVFGFGRSRYSPAAGYWAALAFASIPMVVWEAGTAYVDVANGLYAAMGILFAARWAQSEDRVQADLVLSGIMLGLAAGSKYTGLQVIFAVAVCLLVAGLKRPDRGVRPAVFMAVIAIAIASPWYVKNVVNTGNPVYPFFYSVFKGKNWDAFGDRIYKEQQQTFGAGRSTLGNYTENPLEPSRIGSSILGLAYQPGRYVDPAPTLGLGFPFVNLGAVGLATLLAVLYGGRIKKFEGVVVGSALIGLAMWFLLSQQARYILGLIVPLCVLTGGLILRQDLRSRLLSGAVVIQLLAGVWVLTRFQESNGPSSHFVEKLRVVLGTTTPEEYQKKYVSFYEPAQVLNEVGKSGRVGLFDEVFGYFLDVPYFWAGPGHSTEMGYANLTNGDQFVESLKRLGITVVYVNASQSFQGNPGELNRWMDAAGLNGNPQPYSGDDLQMRMKDPRSGVKVLLAESIASGKLRLLQNFGHRFIFQVQ